MNGQSLDQREKALWSPAPAPFEGPAVALEPCAEDGPLPDGVRTFSLDGAGWEMIDGGTVAERTDPAIPWEGALKARIPNTVHTILYENGVIPDPLFAKNDKLARENSYKTWWFRREFDFDEDFADPRLCFDGVCYNAVFWLNGHFLGGHIGMFGGPEYPVGGLLKKHNVLIVKVENAPADPRPYSAYADHDEGWKYGVVVNCVYGWHYACIPSRGIWAPVCLRETPRLAAERPFIVTSDYRSGRLTVCIKLTGTGRGRVRIRIRPHNFAGEGRRFAAEFEAPGGVTMLRYTFTVDNARLWWPNGYGEQPLYEAAVAVEPEGDLPQVFHELFGIREIVMQPLPQGPRENLYNWTLTVNGRPLFVKGTNWCTTDALLRFPEERYDRFLTLAKAQNLQFLRAWGGGMPESDYFYRRCDELGLMVAQEWPTCWDSQKLQPIEALVETALIHTVRLRNHPSLVQWAGGNESAQADGPAMDALARVAFELDGTRPFHRTSPYGGSLHSYSTFWEMEEMDAALNLRAPFIGEFGMASCPNRESVYRYIPEEERTLWDPEAKTAFNYHTPRFNEFRWPEEYNDMDHLLRRAVEFGEIRSLDDFIFGTQMAQSTAVRHTLEAARADWPQAAGICYYKLTDVYPACSWSTVDYYGVPKTSYYVLRQAYAPLHAMLVIRSIDAVQNYPVVLLDDNGDAAAKPCEVVVRFFDGALRLVRQEAYAARPSGAVTPVGEIRLSAQEAAITPLLIHVELRVDGVRRDDTFYWQNYRKEPGCLRTLPAARLEARPLGGGRVEAVNTGSVPAAGVLVECPEHDTSFTCSDGMFWLDVGESRVLTVSHTEGLRLSAWNVPPVLY
ncbi:MAG TPA: hypothetical protein H9694_10255 [Firmicutes bacterium]|nr:hypothetical protein [Bacillota bacterium]